MFITTYVQMAPKSLFLALLSFLPFDPQLPDGELLEHLNGTSESLRSIFLEKLPIHHVSQDLIIKFSLNFYLFISVGLLHVFLCESVFLFFSPFFSMSPTLPLLSPAPEITQFWHW